MNLETLIKESVRNSIKTQINHNPLMGLKECLQESTFLMEARNQKVYTSDKTERIMVLYKRGEQVILTKKGSSVEGVHVSGNSSKKISFPNDRAMKEFVGEKAADGFTVARTEREISRALRDGSSGITGFLRRHGIKVGIGGALAAMVVGVIAGLGGDDAIRSIGDSIGIGDVNVGSSSDSTGWVPMEVKSVSDSAISGVEQLMSRLQDVEDVQFDTEAELNALVDRLRAQGMDDAAASVQSNLDTFSSNIQSQSASDLADRAARMDATAAAQATADAAAQANASLVQQVATLQQLQADLEAAGNDIAAQGVAQNIQTLRQQIRSL